MRNLGRSQYKVVGRNEVREPKIPPAVARRLGFYVYLYVNPLTQRPFYVGKGKGRRVLTHMTAAGESRKCQMLAELKSRGLSPSLEILAHKLADEETAFRIEAAAIDLLRLDSLTNAVAGWRSLELGRVPLADLVAYYAPRPIRVRHPSLLIRINRLYRHTMSAAELYEATRGIWKVGVRRNSAHYAMAVFEGVVREVYRIKRWHPAGTLTYRTGIHQRLDVKGRWEFSGTRAEPEVRDLYRDRWVGSYLARGAQNPVTYVSC